MLALLLLIATPETDPSCLSPLLPRAGCAEALSPGLRVARIAAEVLGGAVLGTPAIIGGAVLGTMGDHALGREASIGLSIGSALGASLGTAPGVWVAGYLMGGDGSFWWTLAGSTLGTALAATLLAIKSNVEMLGFSAILPLAGAIAGYELSSGGRRATPSSAVVVVPSIGPQGVGLTGAF